MDRRIPAAAALVGLAAMAYAMWPVQQTVVSPENARPTGELTAQQIAQLGIATELARDAGALPLGTVPGVVSLPPSARVAVTPPFAGTVVQVLVIEGEEVRAGQALAVVRAAEPVQFGAELARAEADLEVSRASAHRLERLAAAGVVAGVRADEARATLRRSEASVRENRRLLSIAGAGRDGTVTLRAPISGRLASVSVETGGAVGIGPAPFVVENIAQLRLDLQVPERLAGQVQAGMTVEVATEPGKAPVTGKLLSIAASIDPGTRSVPAKASLDTIAGLVPGRNVMAMISAPGARGGIVVPARAVTLVDGQPCVFVRSGNRFVRRKVSVAATSGDRSILSAGLASGEQVAVAGVAELKSLLAGS